MKGAYASSAEVARQELREVVYSTEALLKALGEETDPAVAELRARLSETVAMVKKELRMSFVSNVRDTISDASDAAAAVRRFVHRHPWTAAAVGTLGGLLVGSLLYSRDGAD